MNICEQCQGIDQALHCCLSCGWQEAQEEENNMSIVKPNEMNFSEDNIIMIVSGLPGVGKTTLAFSAPKPILIDVDNGVKRVKPEHRKDTILVKTYEELLNDIKSKEFKEYKTAIIDTTGAFVELLKDWAMRNNPSACKKGGGISIQGYGIVKSEFLRFSSELKKTHNVIYLFHTTKDKDKDGNPVYDLMCEGAARETVWQPADLGAYFQIIGNKRYLCFSPTQEYSAKSSYGIKGMIEVPELEEGDQNVFLMSLFERVKDYIAKESEAFKPQKEAYDKAMFEGKALIETVKVPDDIQKTLDTIFKMEHALTSEKELKALLKTKMAELNITYNPETKAYEQK